MCDHSRTQCRPGEPGSWCLICGVKVQDVETRPCRNCQHCHTRPGGWLCVRHMMGVTPGLQVAYKIADGSCWTESVDDIEKALKKAISNEAHRNWHHASWYDVPGAVMRQLVAKGHIEMRKRGPSEPTEYRSKCWWD